MSDKKRHSEAFEQTLESAVQYVRVVNQAIRTGGIVDCTNGKPVVRCVVKHNKQFNNGLVLTHDGAVVSHPFAIVWAWEVLPGFKPSGKMIGIRYDNWLSNHEEFTERGICDRFPDKRYYCYSTPEAAESFKQSGDTTKGGANGEG